MEETTSTQVNTELIEVLNKLNNSVEQNTQSINQIQQYLIIKDRQDKKDQQAKEETEQKKAEEEQKTQEEKQEQEALASEESAAKADAQTETYTELLTEINEGVQLTNQLLTVQGIYFGIVIGLLFMKIFIDRLTKK